MLWEAILFPTFMIDIKTLSRTATKIFNTGVGLIFHPEGNVTFCDYDKEGNMIEFMGFPSVDKAQLFILRHSVADETILNSVRNEKEMIMADAMNSCKN
jgi:hypothetical protein